MAGADVNARAENGETPLLLAVLSGSPTKVVPLLLKAGANVNARDKAGRTPLHGVAWLGSKFTSGFDKGMGLTETAALLLKAGANVNARDKDDQTPLHMLTPKGLIEMANLLRSHGGVE